MIYCFDTSAINRLLDDTERDPIIAALLCSGSIRVTAYNVIEAAKTTDSQKRSDLIKLLHQLSNSKRPLDRPNTILLTHAKAHSIRAANMPINEDDNLEGLWVALNQPELIEQDDIDELIDFAKQLEDDFSEFATGDREKFQALFTKSPSQLPKTTATTLRLFLKNKDKCRPIVNDVYKRCTHKLLSDSEYEILVQEPLWPLYFLSHAYAVHRRGIQQQKYSKKNASAIDLFQAVYLTLCDRFVTDDKAQYKGLRLLNVFNTTRRTQVLKYDTFRNRLLVF